MAKLMIQELKLYSNDRKEVSNIKRRVFYSESYIFANKTDNKIMSGWSNIVFPQEIYRWLLSLDVIENKGEVNDKQSVSIPLQDGLQFQNGYFVSEIIKVVLMKNGESASENLNNIQQENSKATKSNNWNFIWLSFQDLRIQFDSRIKELILSGENALISEIVKQLFDRDDNKNTSAMKAFKIKHKPIQNKKEKKAGKGKDQQKATEKGAVDIKKISTAKDPDEAESSLEFLILLLTQSLQMEVEEVLGLFTNQNKYLAHLIVKGINQRFQGVILFYTLLNKHHKKLKSFIESDPKDAHSCLYAVKPGFISKNQQVAEMCITLFLKVGSIYEWFVSDIAKGSATLFLGIKRHPQCLDIFFDLLMEIIQNEEADFFAHQYKKCFRDSYEMTQTSTLLMPALSRSFFKHRLIDMGILDEWIQIALSLFQQQSLDCKVMAYKFMGQVMNYIPESIQANEDYLTVFSTRWKERKLVEYVHLIDQIVLIFERLAGQKNYIAKKLYSIIIEIFDDVYQQPDKKEYLLTQFIEILPDFPSVPVNYLVEVFRDPKLSNLQMMLIDVVGDLSHDPSCLIKVAHDALKYFASDSVTHQFIATTLYRICRKTLDSEQGKLLVLKVVKTCLSSYGNIEITKKNPALIKSQPMYLINKGNSEKVTEEKETEFSIKEGIQKNLISLVDKLSELVTQSINEDLETSLKDEIMETNSFIKKRHFKVGSKALSNVLQKRFGINKQEELDHDEDYNNRKSLQMMEESISKKRSTNVMSASRYGGPPTLRKEFADVIQKKRREEEQRKFQEQKKMRDSIYKKTQVKKQLEKINLLRGFAQEAEIKEDGFWDKFHKQQGRELQLYPPDLMQAKDVQMIDNLFKKYHRLLRSLFLKYTFSMYSTKVSVNFEENKERKETISTVELIKFMKDYKMYFLTSNAEIQSLVREVNVKLLKKREIQELDFVGFEQFIIQFCAIVFTKSHTITAKSSKGQENIKKKLVHLSHSEIVAEWFKYIRTVFIQKGEKTAIFDEPQAAYFNQTEVIKEFNKKLEEDPGFILPEGYKKITEKVMLPEAAISKKVSKIGESYLDVLEVLDQILFESGLGIHIIEPIIKKQTKVRVKPHAFVNVKAKLLDSTETKPRAFSSIIEKKAAIPPIKMMDKKTLSFGMKMGLTYVSYKDKLLGEQVAYVIDDMLDAVEKGRNTIQKQKIVNEVVRSRNEKQARDRKQQIDRKKKMKDRKTELSKLKESIEKKKQKDLQDTKQERQKKAKIKADREKRIQQDKKKYIEQQQKKIKQKKQKDEVDKQNLKEQKKKKREDKKKHKEQFEKFNAKKVQEFSSKSSSEVSKKKQMAEKEKEDQKKKEEMYVKLRQQIHQKDKKAIEMKQKTNEQILQLFNSAPIRQVFKEFEPSMKGLFDFLMQNTYVSITEKKLKNEIVLETWHYFNLVFQLSPFIISSKDLFSIFRSLTKEKQVSADFLTGLSYDEFKQALLRIAIKHKSVFNKISEKIKEDDMTDKEINDVINKDIEEKERNEFDEPKQIDVKSLLREEDVKKEFFNHYGDISKVNQKTLKGLIYYLRVPRDKQGQEERWREVGASKVKYSSTQTHQLKEKLNQEYSLKKQERQRQKQRIRKRLAASQSMNQSMLNNSNMKASSILQEEEKTQKVGQENKAPQES